MAEYGLKAIALHSETVKKHGPRIYDEICRGDWPVVLLSPERLVSPEVNRIIRDDQFLDKLIILGIDELQTLLSWGKEFRKAYLQIGVLRKRLLPHTVCIGVTGTLEDGPAVSEIAKALSLSPGQYTLHRESNERPNVRVVVHELSHTLAGYEFPDLLWIVQGKAKVVVFCATIDLCFRVSVYLWSHLPPDRRLDRVRLWYSLTSADHNARTLQLYRDDPDCIAIVATVAFAMGMNLRNVEQVVNLGLPDSLNMWVQKELRAGRDMVSAAVGRTYVERAVIDAVRGLRLAKEEKAAQALLGASKPRLNAAEAKKLAELAKKKAKQETVWKKKVDGLDGGLRDACERFEAGGCLIVGRNIYYGNPGPEALLDCIEAKRPFPCSNCCPFWEFPSPVARPPPMPPKPVHSPSPLDLIIQMLNTPPANGTKSIVAPTQDDLVYAKSKLREFARRSNWYSSDAADTHYLPIDFFWPGSILTRILNNIHLITAPETLRLLLADWNFLSTEADGLFAEIEALNMRFVQHRAHKQARSLRRRRNTLAASQGKVFRLLGDTIAN